MGRMTYNSTLTADFDDRTLAHLQAAIGAKFRLGESFYFTWHDDVSRGGGHSTIWLHPNIPLNYKYFGGHAPALNGAWLAALIRSADLATGLKMVPEPRALPTVTPPESRHGLPR